MASAQIGSLRVSLGLDSAQFTSGLKNAQNSLQQVGARLKGVGSKLSRNVTAPLAGVATGIAASLGVMSKNIAEVGNQARLAGVGVEDFQKLAFAADTVGVSQEKLADILKDTNDKVGDFLSSGGGELKDFFENIAPKVGVTADAFRDLNSAEALQLYISSLERAGASQQEMTFYLESIADEATALAPILANNGEELGKLSDRAERFGLVSEGNVESARQFNASMTAIKDATASLGRTLVDSGVLTAIASIVERLAEFIAKLNSVSPEIVKFGAIFAGLAAAIGPATIAIGLLVTAIGAISAPVLAVVGGIAALTAGFIAFYPEIIAAKDAVIAFGRDALEYIKGLPAQIVEAFTGLADQMVTIGGQIMDGLKQGISNKIAAVKETISGVANLVISTTKGLFRTQSPSRVFREIGNFLMQGLNLGIKDSVKAVQDTTKGVAEGLSADFKGFFKSVLVEGVKFKDALNNLAQQAVGKLLDSGLNSLFDLIKIPGFASGTNYAPGGMALVGERGPELVNLPRGSQVVPNHALPDSNLSVNVPVQINNMGAPMEAVREPGGGITLRTLDEAVSDSLRRGAQDGILRSQYNLRPVPKGR